MDTEDLLAAFNSGNVFAIPSPPASPHGGRQVPNEIGTHWRLFEVLHPEKGWTRHLVSRVSREGRVCSANQKVDLLARMLQTESGRMYQVVAPRGYDDDAEYAFGVWLRHYKAVHQLDVPQAWLRLCRMKGFVDEGRS